MIVSDKFVFIHLHKTGGQFVREVLINNIPLAKEIGYHLPISKIPSKYSHLPVFAFVRNPYTWYVSWYNFNANFTLQNPVYLVVSANRTANFKTALKNLLELGDDTKKSRTMRQQIQELLPDNIDGNMGIGLVKQDIESLDRPFYSWQYGRMLNTRVEPTDGASPLLIGKMESLRQDLLRFLVLAGVEIGDSLRTDITTSLPVNACGKQNYKSYYDDETIKLVADKESEILGKYGYRY